MCVHACKSLWVHVWQGFVPFETMPAGWAHTFSGSPVIALLGPCLWLWARLHHSLSFSLALWPSSFFFLFFFFLPSVPLFSPCMAHYGWSPPAQSGNCLSVCLHAQHTQTHTQPHSNSAVFRAACRFVGLCTICYKTALLILFGQEVETIVLSHFFLLFSWWKQTVSRLCCGCQSTIFHKALALQP